ncbi:MAG: hypothetical protein OQK32_07060, partial [Gammaproteobacteria bacterium]|nr:hypothetical protein [Gammaproteobacteria bacterium]
MNQLIYKKIDFLFLIALASLAMSECACAEELEEEKQNNKASVCKQLKGETDSWYDNAHTFMSIQFCEPSVWFDSFFSDERADEEVRAGTRVRWQNDFVLTEGGVWTYVTNVRASFKLPKAKERINLIFEGDEEEDLQDVVRGAEEERAGANLGLLYELTKSKRADFTIRVKLSPSITFR